jgi:alginate O-acetyltransferase complex protein AlgI
MVFNTTSFLLFLAAVLAAYFLLGLGRNWKWQNLVLLVASYVSYGFWDKRFLALLAAVTVVNYAAGWAISRSAKAGSPISQRRLWLGLAIAFDLCVLGTFKYFNFFDESLVRVFSSFGLSIDPVSLKLILPLGLSFYIFESISYPFDIYRRKMDHTPRFLDFALFVSFFPTVVSGPIERASHLLPQFQSPREVTGEKVHQGLWLILWGFFQKLVIADSVGLIVDHVYGSHTDFQGLDIAIAMAAYTVQILADFAGYTDIARGVARLLGFDLVLNFNVPYASRNPAEFWERWHISLSRWFRDYVYISLGGNRKGRWRTSLNQMVTMVLCGLWHGAAWTFVVWGAWHGLLLIIYRLFGWVGEAAGRTVKRAGSALLGDRALTIPHPSGRAREAAGRTIKRGGSVLSIGARMLIMVVLVGAGWAVFRATSFSQVAYLFSHLGFSHSENTLGWLLLLVVFTLPLIIVQTFQLRSDSPVFMIKLNPWARGLAYGCLAAGVLIFTQREVAHFIYQGF